MSAAFFSAVPRGRRSVGYETTGGEQVMPVIPLTEQETDDALQSGNSLDELDQFTF